jgi:hypothetical protein
VNASVARFANSADLATDPTYYSDAFSSNFLATSTLAST